MAAGVPRDWLPAAVLLARVAEVEGGGTAGAVLEAVVAGRGDDVPAHSFLGLPMATSQRILHCGHGIKCNADLHNTYFPVLGPPAPAPGHAVSLPELLLPHLPRALASRRWRLAHAEDRGGTAAPGATAAPEPPPPGRARAARRSRSCPGSGAFPSARLGGAGGAGRTEPPAPPRRSPARSVRSRPARCRRSHRSAAAAPEARPAFPPCRRAEAAAGGEEGRAAAGRAPAPR